MQVVVGLAGILGGVNPPQHSTPHIIIYTCKVLSTLIHASTWQKMFKQPEPESAQNVHTNLKQEAGDRAKRGLAKPSQRSPVKKISTIIWIRTSVQ